ncbi:MAG: histidine phosphatase family protein [Thermoleophilia bacterium]|nr:histidine phosphatase family protein [Thermoleophilia bacterium]
MTEITRLLLIRHAQPDEQARGRCYGRLDVGLSARGQRRAQLIARTLERIPLAAVYSSPSARALETATPLAAAHRLGPHVDDALREIDFGELEGRSYDEIRAARPDLYRSWMQTPTRVRFPGGESYLQLRARAVEAMDAIRTRHQGSLAAIVSHGGVLRAMLADCLRMPGEAVFRLDQSYGALSIIDWLDDTPLVRLVNAQPTMVAARRRGFLPAVRFDAGVEVEA